MYGRVTRRWVAALAPVVLVLVCAALARYAGKVTWGHRPANPKSAELAPSRESDDTPTRLELRFDQGAWQMGLDRPSRVLVWTENLWRPGSKRWETQVSYPAHGSNVIRISLPDRSADLLGVAVFSSRWFGPNEQPLWQAYFKLQLGRYDQMTVDLFPGGLSGARARARGQRNVQRGERESTVDLMDGTLLIYNAGHGSVALASVRWGTAVFRPRWKVAAVIDQDHDQVSSDASFYVAPPPDPAVAEIRAQYASGKEQVITWSYWKRWGGSLGETRAFGCDTIDLHMYDPDWPAPTEIPRAAVIRP